MKEKSSCCFGGCLFWIVIIAINILLGYACTDYDLRFWGNLIVGHPIILPTIALVVLGIFGGELFIPLAIVTWILHFFIH